MRENMLDLLADNPIIAAVKDENGLQKVVQSNCQLVFILFGNICNIGQIVAQVKAAGKVAFVDIDLVEGTSNREIVVDFMRKNTETDGIISSKPSIVRAAKMKGFYTIHRFFLIDSMSYHNLPKQVAASKTDCVEILPGCMPKVLGWVQDAISQPVIASGLVCDKEDVLTALQAGAVAISSTSPDVWDNI
ncbi:glycerol-3-phosphate responsive antiterminator [Listeria booriae]|uniref:Glycerol uptake operon antiterminator regulatory protein n=1 Tax=Listeria booriae TaxID=1552123 RepID=A0A7X1D7C9_9LIST|nr:glycerol-3-phosphate responsive antiterminator [Listeria booriae]MBC2175463.1 glycerol-3-phosphate responsive antiterminator [Listeria booriae]